MAMLHPDPPFDDLTYYPTSRWIRGTRGQDTIVDSRRDVDPALLADSDLQTGCPYKGFASYRDVLLNGRRHRGLFWSYQMPFREVAAVEGYLAPYNERVDLIVDGRLQERPGGPLGPSAEPSTPAA